MTDESPPLAFFSPKPDGVDVVVVIDGKQHRAKWIKAEALYRSVDLLKYISEIKE